MEFMELRYLWQLCRAYWRFITVVTVVATVAGLGATYVLPESFEASTDILIRPEQKPSFQQGSAAGKTMDYPVSFNIPPDTISDTYGAIMSSDAIATRVEDQLQLHTRKEEWPTQWWLQALFTVRDYARVAVFSTWDFLRYGRVEPQLPPYWKSVKDIKDGLEAKTVGKTYIFTLTATWADPDDAVKIADTAAAAFVDYSRTARTQEEGTSAGLLGEQVEETAAKLAAARAKLDAFKEKSGTDSLEQEMQLRLDGVAKFEDDRETAKKELSEVDAELGEIQTILGGGSVAKTLRGDSRSQVEAKQTDRLARRKALVARIGSLSATIDRYRQQATQLSSNQSEEQQIALEVGTPRGQLQDAGEVVRGSAHRGRAGALRDPRAAPRDPASLSPRSREALLRGRRRAHRPAARAGDRAAPRLHESPRAQRRRDRTRPRRPGAGERSPRRPARARDAAARTERAPCGSRFLGSTPAGGGSAGGPST